MSILSETMTDLMYSSIEHIPCLKKAADEITLAKCDLATEDTSIDTLIECGDVDGNYCDDCDDDCDDCDFDEDELELLNDIDDDYLDDDDDFNNVDIDDLEGDFEDYD